MHGVLIMDSPAIEMVGESLKCKLIQIYLAFYSIYTIFATKMNKSVLESIRKLLAQVLPPNATARLYGSQARGDAHRGSDWDILIVMDKDDLLPED